MIELMLLVTCAIGPGEHWTVPPGWTVERVAAEGQRPSCFGSVCYAIENRPNKETSVTMSRPSKQGESVAVPEGCKGSVTSAKAGK